MAKKTVIVGKYNILHMQKMEKYSLLIFLFSIALLECVQLHEFKPLIGAFLFISFFTCLICYFVEFMLHNLGKGSIVFTFDDEALHISGRGNHLLSFNKKIYYEEFSSVFIGKDKKLRILTDTSNVTEEISLAGIQLKNIHRLSEALTDIGKEITIQEELKELDALEYDIQENGSITITSKYIFPSKENIFSVILLPFILSVAITDKLQLPNDFLIIPAVIICFYYLSNHLSNKIIITNTKIIYKSAQITKRKIINLIENISKLELTKHQMLIVYNKNDMDCSIDLSTFKRDAIQIIINLLSKKVHLIIDPKIAKEKKYTLPEDAIKEASQITNRRRKVTEIAEMQPIKEANKIIKPRRNVELDSQLATNDNKNKTKRRLEL